MELNHFIPHKKVFQILDAEKIFFKKNYLIDVFFYCYSKRVHFLFIFLYLFSNYFVHNFIHEGVQ